jgi:hypothetical protein
MVPAPELAGYVIPTTPFPPVGGAMDYQLQVIFNIGLWIAVAVFTALALRQVRSTRSPLPLLVLVGGGLCMYIEPIVDILGLCWFWPEGQFVLFEAFGRPIPNWMLPTYIFYVGGQALYTAQRMEKGETMAGVFKLYATYMAVNVVLEMPPLYMGLYTYYGAQPLKLGLFPLWWVFTNAAMPMVLGALIYTLRPYLTGWKVLLVVPLMPMGDALTNGAIAWPTWIALNSTDNPIWTNAAALLSGVFGLIVIWVLGIAVASDSPVRSAARSSVAAAANRLGRSAA